MVACGAVRYTGCIVLIATPESSPHVERQLLSPPGSWMTRSTPSTSPLPNGRRFHPVARMVAALGLILTGILTVSLWWQSRQEFLDDFAYDAAMQARSVTGYLTAQLQELSALQRFIEEDTGFDYATFQAFVRPLLQRKGMQAVEWVPRVTAGDRPSFEAQRLYPGRSSLGITERGADGRLAPAAARPRYYPVAFAAPLVGNERAVGYDLGSDPVRLAALEAARRTGRPQATAPIRLLQERQTQAGFLLFMPVRRQGQTIGFALGVYRAGDMLAAALQYPRVKSLDTAFLDRGAPTGEALLATWRRSPEASAGCFLKARLFPLPEAYFPLRLAGRDWAIRIAATPQYQDRYSSLAFLGILPVGLLLTLLTAYQLHRFLRLQERTIAFERSQLRTLFNTVPDLIWMKDPQGVYLACNRRVERLFGHSEEEIVGRTDYDLVDREQADAFRRHDQEAIRAGGASRSDEWVTFADDGHRELVGTIKCPVYGAKGELIGVLGVARDITAAREATQALKAANAEWERTFDAMPQLIFIIDAQHRILKINQAAQRRLGVTREEATGEFCYRCMHQADGPPSFCPQRQTLADGGCHLEEVLVERLAEYYQVSTTPLFDAAGNYQATIHIATDISERRQHEHALEQAYQAAEAANRAKSAFLATMSHELRTPMNGVLGMAQLLELTPLGPEQQGYLQDLKGSAENLLVLLNDVLDLSRIEAGRLELELAPFPLRRVTVESCAVLGALIERKGLRLDLAGFETLPEQVRGDQVRLRQVLINLVHNAVKFTEQGVVRITARLLHQEAGRVLVSWEVADTGIGIPPDQLQRIFEPFTQADSSTTRRFGGTGLGLSICRQLVELMGGTIGVDSIGGGGSTFRFTVPFQAVPLDDPAAESPEPESGHPFPTGCRVLVVEDNATNRAVALGLLASLGCRADAVNNGVEALEALRRVPYDLVLMDCRMPVMDGYEATRRIRAVDSTMLNPRVTVVAMTANAMAGDREACLEAGMDDYLAKPLRREQLLTILTGLPRPTAAPAAPAVGAAASGGPLFDAGDLLRRMGGSRELAGTVISLFVEDMPNQLQALQRAAASTDGAVAHSVAHAVKGAAASVGAVQLFTVVRALELSAGQADWDGVAVHLSQLTKDFERFRLEVEAQGWRGRT